MLIGGKTLIHVFAVSWASVLPEAYHWHGEMLNTETYEREYTEGHKDKEHVLREAIGRYFEKYDYNDTVLLVGIKTDLFRIAGDSYGKS